MANFNWKTQDSFMRNQDCFVLEVSDIIVLKLQIYNAQHAYVSLYANVNHKRTSLEIANHETDKRLNRMFMQNSENAIEEFKSAAVAILKEQCDQFNNLFNQQ